MAQSILSATSSSPRCWSHLGVSLDTRTGVPPWCRRQGGREPSGSTTTPHLPQTPPHHHASLIPQTQSTHSRFLVPPAEETKLCSTVVSINSI